MYTHTSDFGFLIALKDFYTRQISCLLSKFPPYHLIPGTEKAVIRALDDARLDISKWVFSDEKSVNDACANPESFLGWRAYFGFKMLANKIPKEIFEEGNKILEERIKVLSKIANEDEEEEMKEGKEERERYTRDKGEKEEKSREEGKEDEEVSFIHRAPLITIVDDDFMNDSPSKPKEQRQVPRKEDVYHIPYKDGDVISVTVRGTKRDIYQVERISDGVIVRKKGRF